DDGVNVGVQREIGKDQIGRKREQPAAERAEEKRGEEQPAAEAGAQRDDGGERLEQKDQRERAERNLDQVREFQRTVAGGQDLRAEQREGTDHKPAEGGTQGLPDARLAEGPFAPGDAAHHEDAEDRGEDTQEARNREVVRLNLPDRARYHIELERGEGARDEIAHHRRNADRREAHRRIAADDKL